LGTYIESRRADNDFLKRRLADYFRPRGVERWVMSEELKKQGWIKRTTIGEPRLSEIVDEYEALGFEVRLELVNLEEMDEECRRCYGNEADKFKTVYVRKRRD
jgi:hypothetical protein